MNKAVIKATEKVIESFINHDEWGRQVSYDKCNVCGPLMRELNAVVKAEAVK